MTRLPRISGGECIKALEKAGFSKARQRGSHVVLIRREPFASVTVPLHRIVKPGTLRRILRNIRMSVEEFQSLL